MGYAIRHVIPHHIEEIKSQRVEHVDKVEHQVKARLTKEITYWDRRAQDLKDRERAGKQTRLPAQVAQDRVERLADRLQSRLAELEKERHIVPGPPEVKGGALIIPRGLFGTAPGAESDRPGVGAERIRPATVQPGETRYGELLLELEHAYMFDSHMWQGE